jgi:hypothetical protein
MLPFVVTPIKHSLEGILRVHFNDLDSLGMRMSHIAGRFDTLDALPKGSKS